MVWLVVEISRSATENWTTSSFGVHHYIEMQPGNHSTPNKPTTKRNATVEKYKANKVITRWSLQNEVTPLCHLPDFQSEAIVCVGWTRGREVRGVNDQ